MEHITLTVENICKSLVCVHGPAPYPWGNYFFIGSVRVVNMWYENVTALKLQELRGYLFSEQVGDWTNKWFVVSDDRIPSNYYYGSLNFTGSPCPSNDLVTEMITVHPAPNTEKLREFTDTAAWDAEQGITRIERNGYVIKRYDVKNTKPAPDLSKYTIENPKVAKVIMDDSIFYCPYIPSIINPKVS